MTTLVKTTSPEEEELRRKKEGLPHGTGAENDSFGLHTTVLTA